MKKIFYTFMAMAAALSVAGCAKELEESAQTPGNAPEEESGYIVLGASLPEYPDSQDNAEPQTADTKTTISQNPAGTDGKVTYSVNWSEEDKISVNGKTSTAINIDPDNAKNASFTLPVVEATFCAVYPASSYIAGTYSSEEAKDSLNITVPANQEYVADRIDPESAIMLAYSKDGSNLQFKHAMAYLKLTVNGADVKSVRVNGNYNDALSGEFTAKREGNGTSLAFAPKKDKDGKAKGNTSITYSAATAVPAGTPMFIAIPASTYSKGLTLTVVDGEGHYQVIKSTNSFPAVRGKIYPTSVDFNSQEVYIEGGIYTVEDWNAFIASVNADDWSAWKKTVDGKEGVHLMADIYSATNLPRTITTVKWNGTFYGNNHTITHAGFEPLFLFVGENGKIQDLKVAGERTTNANNNWVGTIAMDNEGTIENCENLMNITLKGSNTNAAGICRTNTGSIINCKNTGKITISNPTAPVNVAGIVMYSSGTLTGCTNECEINIMGVNQDCVVGGIAQSVGGTEISNLTNNAAIIIEAALTTANTRRTVYVGGITANAEYNGKCSKLVKCENYGDLSIMKSGKNFIKYGAIGGVVAAISKGAKGTEGDTFTGLTNCSNAGHISFYESETESTSIGYAFGGIVGRCVHFSENNYHYGDGGYYMVMRNGNNTGNITVYAANGQKASNASTGARQTYVGGLVGFACGASASDKAIVRGKSNCTITTGSTLGGDMAGGLVGGGAMLSIDTNPTATTTFKAYSDDKLVGYWGAALGWTTSKAAVIINGAETSATFEPGNVTPLGQGLAGVTTGKTLTVTGCKYNGNTVTTADIYGGGTSTIK